MIGSKISFKNNAVAKLGETATRRRTSDTNDSMGGKISQTASDTSVTIIVGNITAKDIGIAEMGLAVQGNLKLYFDADQDIIEGDTIIRSDSKLWRVETIASEYDGVFSVAVIRNISLTGSS